MVFASAKSLGDCRTQTGERRRSRMLRSVAGSGHAMWARLQPHRAQSILNGLLIQVDLVVLGDISDGRVARDVGVGGPLRPCTCTSSQSEPGQSCDPHRGQEGAGVLCAHRHGGRHGREHGDAQHFGNWTIGVRCLRTVPNRVAAPITAQHVRAKNASLAARSLALTLTIDSHTRSRRAHLAPPERGRDTHRRQAAKRSSRLALTDIHISALCLAV